MSALIFPPYSPVSGFAGQQLTKYRRPTLNTHTQRALSGKESRIALRAYPLMEWELSFDWLPDNQLPAGQGRTNYVTYSQDGTQWTASDSSSPAFPAVLIPNATIAPDGTLTASRVILNSPGGASTQYSYVNIPNAYPPFGVAVTPSIWMKTNDGTTVNVLYQTSYVGSKLCVVTPQWQRFSFAGTTFASGGNYTPQFQVYNQPSAGASQYADISVWGAQLELGSVATRYIVTDGSPIRQSDFSTMLGFFTGVLGQWDTFLYQDPDFNTVLATKFGTGNGSTTSFNLVAPFQPQQADLQPYLSPGGLSGQPEWVQNTNGKPQIYTARYGAPELLSAGSRTNLALQSNFAATWTTNNATITAGTTTSPDGTTDAATFNEGTATGQHYVELTQSGVLVANSRNTFSVWLRANQTRYVTLFLTDNGTNGALATFDLLNGVVSQTPQILGTAYASAADAQISGPYPANQYATNGFWRCSITCQFASTAALCAIAASNVAQPGSGFASYTGTSNTFFMFGAQLEAGSYPTALIPVTTAHLTNGGSDYSLTNLSSAGRVQTFQQVQFTSAPANGVPLLWSGSFFYRVRFSEDAIEPAEFLSGHWKLDSLKLEQVLL